eukprot:TRINITY_DN2092_c0_g3_i1.p1 TRINITY_DN2092_c0_g3~~TRINITY_DN2092_c0_g3_i1.p1  ORF type:complete len:272 (-),score=63.19 TRINITY_DN2092_c0_g3_i1:56-871(-)
MCIRDSPKTPNSLLIQLHDSRNNYLNTMAFLYCAVLKHPGAVLCEFQGQGVTSVCKSARDKSKEVYKEKQELVVDREYSLYSLKYSQDSGLQFIYLGRTAEVYAEKAYAVLTKVRRDFLEEFFGGDAGKFKGDKVYPMCYQQDFSPTIEKLLKVHETGINMGTVRTAQTKINETAQVIQGAIKKQMENNYDTIGLYDQSTAMRDATKTFLKETVKLENQVKRNSFWMCSRNCLLMICVPTVVIILYICFSFVYCGDLTALVGCRYANKSNN